MQGINQCQISNLECQNCKNKTLQVSEIQGREVRCAICRTEFAVMVFSDGKFSLLKLEG